MQDNQLQGYADSRAFGQQHEQQADGQGGLPSWWHADLCEVRFFGCSSFYCVWIIPIAKQFCHSWHAAGPMKLPILDFEQQLVDLRVACAWCIVDLLQ